MADRRLHEFVRALRGAGVRVSPTEAEEAFRAAALIGYHPRDQFRETLALTLVRMAPAPTMFWWCAATATVSTGKSGCSPGCPSR